MPALGGHLNERLARRGGHGAQLRAHRGRGAAAEGAHVPRNEIGVAHDHGDGVEGYTQFFRNLLRKRGADILAHFNLAREDFHLAVGVDVQPRAEVFGKFMTASAAAGLLRHCGVRREADKKPPAKDFEKAAAVELQRGRWMFRTDGIALNEHLIETHPRPPCADERAARWTAATMRGYVPQRQMLPFIASTICASEGLCVSRSSDVALMIMPEVQ